MITVKLPSLLHKELGKRSNQQGPDRWRITGRTGQSLWLRNHLRYQRHFAVFVNGRDSRELKGEKQS